MKRRSAPYFCVVFRVSCVANVSKFPIFDFGDRYTRKVLKCSTYDWAVARNILGFRGFLSLALLL
jgi:hypothetical protein